MPEDNETTTTSTLDAAGVQSSNDQASGRDFEAEVAKLRAENAKWRTQLRETQQTLEDLKPLAEKAQQLEEAQKTEAEKLAERIAQLEGQASAAQAQAARAAQETKLVTLASQAGVPANMLQFLDASKFNLDDEESALEALSALAPKNSANAGKPSNPARGGNTGEDDPATWWKNRKQGSSMIFGGN